MRWIVGDARFEIGDTARYREVYRGFDGCIYENMSVLPRFFASDRTTHVDIVKARTTRYDLRIQSSGRSLVRSSIPLWPGWRVTVNGKSVTPLRANGAFIAFPVPAGASSVIVRYLPLPFWIAAVVSLLTIIALLLVERVSRL